MLDNIRRLDIICGVNKFPVQSASPEINLANFQLCLLMIMKTRIKTYVTLARCLLISGMILVMTPGWGRAQTCTVDWNNVHQRIDGFGASSAWRSTWSTAQADMFFSTNNGIGLSLLRNHMSMPAHLGERDPDHGETGSCNGPSPWRPRLEHALDAGGRIQKHQRHL